MIGGRNRKLIHQQTRRRTTATNASANMDPFKKSIGNLRQSAIFSDFVIKCQGKEHKIHRAVVASHSAYFKKCFQGNYQEAQAGEIDLKEDDPDAIEKMIDYFYDFDYKETSSLEDPLELHVLVYAAAEKYEVLELKALAVEKFKESLLLAFDGKRNPIKAFGLAFETTPESDRKLRNIILETWETGEPALMDCMGRAETAKALQAAPSLSMELSLWLTNELREQVKDAATWSCCYETMSSVDHKRCFACDQESSPWFAKVFAAKDKLERVNLRRAF